MKKLVFFIVLVSITTCCLSQSLQYTYRREIQGVKNTWHKILLPDDIYAKVSPSLSDIRILSVDGKDTAEAPYILTGNEQQKAIERSFQLINRSVNDSGFYYTFQLQQASLVSNIRLQINAVNYDWLTDLEGSNDNQNWFTLLTNYRIVGLQNEKVNFKFNTIDFPQASYRFFRLCIKSKVDPQFAGATLTFPDSSQVTIKFYKAATTITKDANDQSSVIAASLYQKVPVSFIKLIVTDTVDYLRQVNVEQMTDSFQTEKGWQYNYESVFVGAIHSGSANEIRFPVTIAQKFRIRIFNRDNSPLQISGVTIGGPQYALNVRMSKKGRHFLFYGNRFAVAPEYDIKHFIERVPADPQMVELEKEELLSNVEHDKREPLFKNKLWLWIILLLIVAIVGWFSIRMLKQKSTEP